MRKTLFILWLCLSAVAVASPVETIPVLDGGRIKPFDTFARTQLLSVYGKRSLPGMPAFEWLLELLRGGEKAFHRPIFNLRNPDLVDHLGLDWREKHLYSFNEIWNPIREQEQIVHQLHQKEKGEKTPLQNQLVDLYFGALNFYELHASFSLVLPKFQLTDPKLAQYLKLEPNHLYNYMEMQGVRLLIEKEMGRLAKKDPKRFSEQEWAISRLAYAIAQVEKSNNSNVLHIFPPQWNDKHGEWFSPWQVVGQGEGSPASARYLESWQHFLTTGDGEPHLFRESLDLSDGLVKPWRLKLEVFYNKGEFFTKSLVFYLLGFLLLIASWGIWRDRLRIFSFASAGIGFLFHTAGLVMRILIMVRPPVSTLYESILFVSFIAVLFGLILERVRRNGFGLLVATTVGTLLHFIGIAYASEGDTLGMLVAVLNTNFWLATHVVTITIGYGCCFVGGVLGHAYLVFHKIFPLHREKLKEIYHISVGVALVALFFSLFGTILGGIWADQSWGRFWGWDPKENGALLIVLWLLFLLHGILTKHVKELGFALGMVLTNIVVALAWFGVNLLNIGLHSYGFAENIFFNLMIFCAAELLFGFGMYLWIKGTSKNNENSNRTIV